VHLRHRLPMIAPQAIRTSRAAGTIRTRWPTSKSPFRRQGSRWVADHRAGSFAGGSEPYVVVSMIGATSCAAATATKAAAPDALSVQPKMPLNAKPTIVLVHRAFADA
jgi:hypothetical protein